LEVIAELAGHADLDVTRIYVKVADDAKQQAIHATFTTGRSALGRAGQPSPGRAPA
jgi:hypothetical protein